MEHEHGQDEANPAGLARRSLLAAGLTGAAVTLAPLLQNTVGASTPPGSEAPGGTEPATTTTAAPLRPTAADTELLGAAESLELAAAALYRVALTKHATGDTGAVLAAIQANHNAYAQALSGLLGSNAPGTVASAIVDGQTDAFTGDAATMLAAATKLEADLAQTHAEAIPELQSVSGARVLASIAVIEARHGTVLADLANVTNLHDLLAPEGEALSVEG